MNAAIAAASFTSLASGDLARAWPMCNQAHNASVRVVRDFGLLLSSGLAFLNRPSSLAFSRQRCSEFLV